MKTEDRTAMFLSVWAAHDERSGDPQRANAMEDACVALVADEGLRISVTDFRYVLTLFYRAFTILEPSVGAARARALATTVGEAS